MPFVTYPNSGGGGGGGGGGVANPLTSDLAQGAYNITSSGGNSIWTVLPAAGGAGIQAAYDAAATAGAGIIQLFEGVYSITSQIVSELGNNITIQGMGDSTVLEVDSTAANFPGGHVLLFDANFLGQHNLSNMTEGATSITFTNAVTGGTILTGDAITLQGTDVNSEKDGQVVFAAANGDGGTGIVTITTPILRTMTSCVGEGLRNSTHLVFKNFKIKHITGTNALYAINLDHSLFCMVDNVTVENFTNTLSQGMRFQGAAYCTVKNCRIIKINSYGVNMLYTFYARLLDTLIEGAGVNGDTSVLLDFISLDAEIKGNKIYNSGGNAISVLNTSGAYCRRVLISNNNISNAAGGEGIYILSARDGSLISNSIDRSGVGYCIRIFGAKRFSVIGNNLMNSVNGLGNTDSAVDNIFSGNAIGWMSGRGIICGSSSAGTTINGNNVFNCGSDGIYLADSTRLTLTGNTTRANGGDGIEVTDTTTNSLVVGNNCQADGITQGIGAGNVFASNIV